MNNEEAKAIRDRYFAISAYNRALVSARVLGINLARIDFFESKAPTDPDEYAKILVSSWFFKDLKFAIEVTTK